MKKLSCMLFILMFPLLGLAQTRPAIEWVTVPGGTFMMGSPETEEMRGTDEVLHPVTVSSFQMSKYEITFEQYDQFCEATGKVKPDDRGYGRSRRPVMGVSWEEARAFAEWMGCRLPTEAEWEYACRAGSTTPFSSGQKLSVLAANFWSYDPDNIVYPDAMETKPVGMFEANSFGLMDMYGNVYEWCSDYYGNYPSTAQTNPVGPASGTGRIFRGGDCRAHSGLCRSAFRGSSSFPDYRHCLIGIRLVKK